MLGVSYSTLTESYQEIVRRESTARTTETQSSIFVLIVGATTVRVIHSLPPTEKTALSIIIVKKDTSFINHNVEREKETGRVRPQPRRPRPLHHRRGKHQQQADRK